MRCTRYVTNMGKMRNVSKLLVKKKNLKGRNLGHLGTDERTVLKWILKNEGVREWIGIIYSVQGPEASFCELGNEPSGSIKGGEFLD
jgi:hypothetical protein